MLGFAIKLKQVKKYKYIYLLALPSFLYILLFEICPLFGLQIAFKSFNYNDGIWGSAFIGLNNFKKLFSLPDFWRAIKNSMVLGSMHLVFSFPAAIVLAIVFSEIKNKHFKKITQLVSTFPHFLSWVLVASLCFNILGNYGFINSFFSDILGVSVPFFSNPGLFRWVLIFSYIWKDVGWDSLIFFAAICNIDKSMYEAAEIEGVTRLHKTLHITLPAIKNVIITMFLLQVGYVFTAGFSQVYNLYNPTVYETADVLGTYLYRLTFSSGQNFGMSAAASLIESSLNIMLLLIAEFFCKRITHESLFADIFQKNKNGDT